jgi:hypothetical protein
MTPVDQTIFRSGAGDCLRACVATITGIPLEQIPNFCAEPDAWYERFSSWLSSRGFAPYSVGLPDAEAVAEHLEWARVHGTRIAWIAGGQTARGRHFVVYRGHLTFHDPNPFGRDGLTRIEDATFLLRASG